jgi:hypothetical protein
MMKKVILLAVLLAVPAAWADEVFLRGGGSIHGEVVQRTSASVVMEVGPGRMTLPMSRVDRIVATTSDLSIYRQKAARLASGDGAGWLVLARWAEGRDLLTQAREAYERVVAIDPENAAANAALGRVRLAGRWVTAEESYRARGYVPFEGGWVTPEERTAIVGDRAAEARARALTAEAEARPREAEARARTAEADARRAEAEAQGTSMGIPYPYGYGGVGVYGGGIYGRGIYGARPRGVHGARVPVPVIIDAPPRPPTRDEGGSAPPARRHGTSMDSSQKH